MRKLFQVDTSINRSWKDGKTPEDIARIEAQTKAYWLEVFGPREVPDFKAIAKAVANADPTPPAPECAICRDMGYVSYNAPVGDPLFGKLFPCPDCEKGRGIVRDQWARKYQRSELPKQYQGFTFQSWEATIHEEGKIGKYPAYSAALQFVENAEHMVDLVQIYAEYHVPWDEGRDMRPKNSLVFYGDYGTGKSGLMAAIVNELMARGESCLYVSTHSMIEDVQDSYQGDAEMSTKEVMGKYKMAPVLFADDFNIHNTSRDKLDKIEQIIRYRYTNMLPTLMTMNINQDEFLRMWSDRSGVAAVAMAHWIKLEGAVLRRADPPVNDEAWWQR